MNPDDIKMQAVALTPYEWHVLLREMEWLMSIANRPCVQTKCVYARIGSQLNDQPVTVAEQPA